MGPRGLVIQPEKWGAKTSWRRGDGAASGVGLTAETQNIGKCSTVTDLKLAKI
ncbi:hypothetical protein PAXRUDRAFT_833136 [Paxillus rubicundulus Ve08.2h10]|uniref:Uncharacterized protein n=1 Tax=Paxillus rubicundulus Ve08.2h10 TaxID=930991 RepID=A0A0D0DHS4_9AGAM|nr:hypothetical protein PAXRUDRAFT_833136 [Paxillus rubicundulus Ve08.2h10]